MADEDALDPATWPPWLEALRRLGLLAGLAGAAWLYCAAYHGPYFRTDGSGIGERLGRLRALDARGQLSTGNELQRWLAGVRKADLFPDVDRIPDQEWESWRHLPDQVVPVRGPEWEAFLRSAPGRHFRPSEAPLGPLLEGCRADSYALRLEGLPGGWLDVRLSSGQEASLGGSGFKPASFFRPLRPLAPWSALAGLLLYLLTPWPRRHPNVVALARWRLVLTDLVGTGMFMLFFSLPLFIVGSSTAAVTEWMGLTAVFWLLALLSAVIVYWAVWYGAYRIVVLDDRLVVEALDGREAFAFADISSVRSAVLRPPRWLVLLGFLGVLAGKGASRRAGQAGRALILSTSAAGGYHITTRDGRSAYIWYTDSMGGEAFQNLERLKAAVARMPSSAEPAEEIRAFFPPSR